MTVNTNGNTPVTTDYPEPASSYVTDEANILHDIRNDVAAIRESQRVTQELVESFIVSMSKNPMLGAMAKMMGGKR